MDSNDKKEIFEITFETNLNASMKIKVRATNKKAALRQLKRYYPSAFNIEIR